MISWETGSSSWENEFRLWVGSRSPSLTLIPFSIMDFSECSDYLERLGNEVLTMKFGLDTIRTLLRALGNPEVDYPVLLLAGTNGKGSVARFVSSICSASGMRAGLFTSPHLVSIRERVSLDGRLISEEQFAEHLTFVVSAIDKLKLEAHPTFFETVTAVALHYFSRQEVDIAVMEVGLGGRLDSTNVVEPALSVLTRISYDHQQYLGNTLDEIAGEKAGILRPSRPALSLPQCQEVSQALQAAADDTGARLETIDRSQIVESGHEGGRYNFVFHGQEYRLGTCGVHQIMNAALAVRAAEKLQEQGFTIDTSAIYQGIRDTRVPGVVERVGEDPEIFLDGGHNPEAAANLVRFLEEHTEEPRNLVFGIMRDKMVDSVLTILVKACQQVYVTQIPSPRAASIEDLLDAYPQAVPVACPEEAFKRALSGAATVVVAGSFHLVGEISKVLRDDFR